jgi:hypothetical protein
LFRSLDGKWVILGMWMPFSMYNFEIFLVFGSYLLKELGYVLNIFKNYFERNIHFYAEAIAFCYRKFLFESISMASLKI